MAERDTLLAHLAPKYLTGRIEDAATDALAYILNTSDSTLKAFNDLVVNATGVPMEDCVRFATQVVAPDRSRPDFVGYDGNGKTRVIGESKFWHSLGKDQVKAYLDQLSCSDPAVLLFVVPDTRTNTLWADVNSYVGREQQCSDRSENGTVRVGVMPDNHLHRIMMIGWVDLLKNLEEATRGNPGDVASEIRQLKGLAMQQDREAFLPLKKEELAPEFPRRVLNLVDIVDAAIDRGRTDGWLNTDRLTSSRTGYWYARWFHFSSVEGDQWFGLDYRTWAMRGESPLWLWIYEVPEKLREKLTVKLYDGGGGTFAPIYLPIGVDREKVLDSVVTQLKEIGEALIPPAKTRRRRVAST